MSSTNVGGEEGASPSTRKNSKKKGGSKEKHYTSRVTSTVINNSNKIENFELAHVL